jgi:hypothetical protein
VIIFVIQKRSVSLLIGFLKARYREPQIMKKKEIVAKIIDKFILMIINFNFYISFDATKTMLKEVDLRHSYITPSIKWGVG